MSARTQGVLHAKYFVVDGREAYLGSQNFDWRALAHQDRARAGPRCADARGRIRRGLGRGGRRGSAALACRPEAQRRRCSAAHQGGAPALTPLANRQLAADEALWDLPRIKAMIDGARQLITCSLSCRTLSRDGSPFPTSTGDAARRRAGVDVRCSCRTHEKRAIEGRCNRAEARA
jgi:hypothetical protein